MATLVLTWNPANWEWKELPQAARSVRAGTPHLTRWSTGNRKQVAPGDRFFMVKQGEGVRGVIGSGLVTADGFQAAHRDNERAGAGDLSNYVQFRFDTLVDPEAVLRVDELVAERLAPSTLTLSKPHPIPLRR